MLFHICIFLRCSWLVRTVVICYSLFGFQTGDINSALDFGFVFSSLLVLISSIVGSSATRYIEIPLYDTLSVILEFHLRLKFPTIPFKR